VPLSAVSIYEKRSTRRRRRRFETAFEAAAVRHAEITSLQKNQLELNKNMLLLEEARLQIPEQDHISSERRFNMDEERLGFEKIKFKHQKDQDRIKMELERKENASNIKLVSALAKKLLQ
jgi:hypothetical protein